MTKDSRVCQSCEANLESVKIGGRKRDWCPVCREVISNEPWEYKSSTLVKVDDLPGMELREWRAEVLTQLLKYGKLSPSCVDNLTPDAYCNPLMLKILKDGLKKAGVSVTGQE